MKQKIEGYWYSDIEYEYPKVTTQIKDSKISEDFVRKLLLVQNSYKVTKKYTKGFSICRICNCSNESGEYSTKHWIWPEGYLHYLLEHNVHPTEEFYNYIMDFKL